MAEIDRVMIEDLGIELLQMMENAGRSLAQLAIEQFAPRSVGVLVGPGGNGGGGLVAARHLMNHGVTVEVARSHDRLDSISRHQFEILGRMQVDEVEEPSSPDLVIDALLGYSLDGDPRGRSAALIEWANSSGIPILALDTPSGLDVTSGRAGNPCVAATATLTLALPKRGLIGAEEVGDLYVADITVPPSVYAEMGLPEVDLFTDHWIVRLT